MFTHGSNVDWCCRCRFRGSSIASRKDYSVCFDSNSFHSIFRKPLCSSCVMTRPTKPPRPAGGILHGNTQDSRESHRPNEGWFESRRPDAIRPEPKSAGRNAFWGSHGNYIYNDHLQRSTLTTTIMVPDDSFVDFQYSRNLWNNVSRMV